MSHFAGPKQSRFCLPHPASSWLRSQKQLNMEIERKLKGDHYCRFLNLIEMDRENERRHDKWCQTLHAVFSMERTNPLNLVHRPTRSDFIDKVIDNGFHCESNDRLQITWTSPDILKWNPLDIVDGVLQFFNDYNQSLDSI